MNLVFSLLVALFPIALAENSSTSSWYSEPVSVFYEKGYLDPTISFSPDDLALRSEFVKLIVDLKGGADASHYTTAHFDDVPTTNPYFEYFEFAGRRGWITGEGNCYDSSPCYANPNTPINRAGAATLMMRAFDIEKTEHVPQFDDNTPHQWFTKSINAAASVCILRGDSDTSSVRPNDNLSWAEMIVMLHRLHAHLHYPECNKELSTDIIPNAPTLGIQTVTDFRSVYSLFVTFDGILYAADAKKAQVWKYTRDLKSRSEVSISDTGFTFPHSIGFDKNGIMLIADHRHGNVARFAKDGSFIGYFDEGALTGPVNTHLDHRNNIWITDYEAHNIKKYSPSGEFIGMLGHNTINGFATSGESIASSRLGKFDSPHMVTVDNNDNIYVVDVRNDRIQKFESDGSFIGWIGGLEDGSVTNSWSATGKSAESNAPGGLNNPTAITIAGSMLIVADTNNHRIVRYYADTGAFAGWMGGKTDGNVTVGWEMQGNAKTSKTLGAFADPFYVQVYNNKLYVADTGNKRIQIIPLHH